MAYVAVKGGQHAIEESIRRIKYERLKDKRSVSVKDIQSGMRLMIDQVMSEASLYSKELAAAAIKQGEGSLEEAVFLLRAYRSTLPRKYYSIIVESDTMRIERRISAAFKDIPGGQMLGTNFDYKHRLFDLNIENETIEDIEKYVGEFEEDIEMMEGTDEYLQFPKVADYLRHQGLLAEFAINDEAPKDVTKEQLSFPTVRSERLQILTRGMTQGVNTLAYASLRGYGAVHPTVAELRVGAFPIYIADPVVSEDEEEQYYIGEIKVTEVESLIPVMVQNDEGKKEINFAIGYGIALGQNETKAISMSILDQTLESKDSEFPTSDEEFVLYHIDSVEATGFISHLKLPHYVTFQAKLNDVRKIKRGEK